MKRLFKLTALLSAALIMLTACSAVFDSAISGTIKDRSVRETSSSSAGGISDVMVYAYTNESDWNAKYSEWSKTKDTVFSDNSVPSAKTASDGSFSISNLRWMTNNPAYGKDADEKKVYLLAFHKDYGLEKIDGRTIQSDKSNNFGIVYMDKVTATKTLVIRLKDRDDNSTAATGNDQTITDTSGISFRYRYADGYAGTEQNVTATVDSFTNGQASITVKYKAGGSVPSVTLYDIQTGSDWSLESDKDTIECVYSNDEYTNTSISLVSKWKTVTVSVKLVDASSADLSSVTDPIYFRWSYENGDGSTKEGNETTTDGTSSIAVKFRRKASDGTDYKPVLTLTQFQNNDSNEDKWTWTKSETDSTPCSAESDSIKVNVTAEKDTLSQKVYFRKEYIKLPSSGIYGYLITSDTSSAATMAEKATGYGYKCDYGDELYLYRKSDSVLLENNSVRTGKSVTTTGSSSGEAIVDYGYFTGLGSSVKLRLTYSGTGYSGVTDELEIRYRERGSSLEVTAEDALTFNAMTTDFSVMLYKD